MRRGAALCGSTFFCFAVACATSRPAPPPAPEPEPEPEVVQVETESEGLAYQLGRMIVENLDVYHFTEREQIFVLQGVRDELVGDSDIEKVERKALAMGLRELMKTRAQELIDEEKAASEAYLSELRMREDTVAKDSGIVIMSLAEGDGDYPEDEEEWIKFHSRAWLRDGKEILSSFDAEEPSVVQQKYFLPCWKEVLPHVRMGGRVTFACPPELVYGDEGRTGMVPPGAAVSFEVELLEVVDDPFAEQREEFSEGSASGETDQDTATSPEATTPPAGQ